MGTDCGCSNTIVQVQGGTRSRDNVYASMPCHLLGCSRDYTVIQLDDNGNEVSQAPSQCITSLLPTVDGTESELVWLVDHLGAGEKVSFAIAISTEAQQNDATGARIDIKD